MRSKFLKVRNIVYLLLIIFIILNINFLIKNQKLSKELRKYSILYNTLIISYNIFNFRSTQLHPQTIELLGTSFRKYSLNERLGKENSRFLFAIFFSLRDCPACLEEASVWQEIHKKYKIIKVVGISNTKNNEEMDIFKREFKIDFPIITNHELFKEYKIRQTPLKFFINSKGTILFIDGPHNLKEDQLKLPKLVEKIIQIYHR